MSKNDVELKIDWATHAAAKYACEHWHYSATCPMGKQVYMGVWENKKFIGVILFRNGAKDLGTPYGLTQIQVTELARVALTKHKTEVSRILSIAIKKLKAKYKGIKLIVSFADEFVNHHGGIYQAGNWIYTGKSGESVEYFYKNKWYHSRDFRSSEWSSVSGMNVSSLKKRKRPGKHRYLMPLDKEMRKQILPLAQPYPKKNCPVGVTGNTSDYQSEDGGSIPTAGLISTEV